jgi:hypothetical protein
MKEYSVSETAVLEDWQWKLIRFMHTPEYDKLPLIQKYKFGAELIRLGHTVSIGLTKRKTTDLEWLQLEIGESTTTHLRNRGTIYSSGFYHGMRFTSRKENGRLTVTRIA